MRTDCRALFSNKWSWDRARFDCRCVVKGFKLSLIAPVGCTGRGRDYIVSRFWANLFDLPGKPVTLDCYI